MTDSLQPDDERDELASATLDGEAAPEDIALVASDPGLQERVAELGEMRDEVRSLADIPADDARREQAVAAALAAFDHEGAAAHSAEPPETAVSSLVDVAARRTGTSPRTLRIVAAAAVVALVALAVPLLVGLGDEPDDSATETAALDLDEQAGNGSSDGLDAAPEVAEDSAAFESGAPGAGTVAPDNGALGSDEQRAQALASLGSFDDLEALARGVGDALARPTRPTTAEAAATRDAECVTATIERLEADGERLVLRASAVLAGERVVALVTEFEDAGQTLTVVAAEGSCRIVAAESL